MTGDSRSLYGRGEVMLSRSPLMWWFKKEKNEFIIWLAICNGSDIKITKIYVYNYYIVTETIALRLCV